MNLHSKYRYTDLPDSENLVKCAKVLLIYGKIKYIQ